MAWSPGVHPAFPGSELLLIGCYHLNLKVVLEVLEEAVLLKQARPADLTAATQELVTDVHSPCELILHMTKPDERPSFKLQVGYPDWVLNRHALHINCEYQERPS